MNREEEIIRSIPEGYNDTDVLMYLRGALWADEHPRTDIIERDSISFCRMLLVSKFCDIAKKYDGKKMDEVPEMKEAFDIVNNFDKACEFAGYKLDEDKGIFERLEV